MIVAVNGVADGLVAARRLNFNDPQPFGYTWHVGGGILDLIHAAWWIVALAALTTAITAILHDDVVTLSGVFRRAFARFFDLLRFEIRAGAVALVPVAMAIIGVIYLNVLFAQAPSDAVVLHLLEGLCWIAIIAAFIRYALPLLLAWMFAAIAIIRAKPPLQQSWKLARSIVYEDAYRGWIAPLVLIVAAAALALAIADTLLMHVAMHLPYPGAVEPIVLLAGELFWACITTVLIAAWDVLAAQDPVDAAPSVRPSNLRPLVVPFLALSVALYAVYYPHNETRWRTVRYTQPVNGMQTSANAFYNSYAECHAALGHATFADRSTSAYACDRPQMLLIGWQ